MSRRPPPSEALGAIALAVYRPDVELLAEQIRSIAAQTRADWRCHIGIDGTDDATHELVRGLVDGDDRFTVHHYPENLGIFHNFERIIGEVTADAHWVALSDQDDSWDADKLDRLVNVLESDPDVAAVVGQARVVDVDGQVRGRTQRRGVSLAALLLDNQVTGSLAVFDRRVLDLALPFPVPTLAAYHDHWLGVAAACLGRVAFVDFEVQDYVQHAGNALGEETSRGPLQRVRALAERSWDPRHLLDRLAVERWGWRARMASAVTARLVEDGVPGGLSEFAQPRLGRTSWVVGRAVLCREAGAQRSLAIWLGFLWSRVSEHPTSGARVEEERA